MAQRSPLLFALALIGFGVAVWGTIGMLVVAWPQVARSIIGLAVLAWAAHLDDQRQRAARERERLRAAADRLRSSPVDEVEH